MLEFEFLALLASLIGLFVWNRSESRADIRHMDNKLEIYVQAIREDINQIHRENHDLISSIREDMKDFHGRLCIIEERNKTKN